MLFCVLLNGRAFCGETGILKWVYISLNHSCMPASQKLLIQEWCVTVFPSPILFAGGMSWFALICWKADVTLCGDSSTLRTTLCRDNSTPGQLCTETTLHHNPTLLTALCRDSSTPRTTLRHGQLCTEDNSTPQTTLHCWPLYTEDSSTPGTYLHPGQLWTSPTLAGIINQMANGDH